MTRRKQLLLIVERRQLTTEALDRSKRLALTIVKCSFGQFFQFAVNGTNEERRNEHDRNLDRNARAA